MYIGNFFFLPRATPNYCSQSLFWQGFKFGNFKVSLIQYELKTACDYNIVVAFVD